MTNEELSVAIATAINGVCEEHGAGDRVAMLNAMANCANFCIRSLLINIGAEPTLDLICRMHRECETEELMTAMGAPGYDAH